MFRSKLTVPEARLPKQCQKHAVEARKRSQRIRIQIALLLVFYTARAGFQVVGSIFNARRESNNAFARELPCFVTFSSSMRSMKFFACSKPLGAHSRLASCDIKAFARL